MSVEKRSVFDEFIEDPYASGRFENLGSQGLPEDVYNELLRVAADKHVSIYYLAAIYKRGQADALAAEDDGSYLWQRCYACGHRLAFASDSCPQCGIHFVAGDDPPNWPETCQCDRCTEARNAEG
jgi:hypothetical protein